MDFYSTIKPSYKLVLILGFIVIFSSMLIPIHAENENLVVETDSGFPDYFHISVVEVKIVDSDISAIDEPKGEPDVTVNGRTLRMAQATNGWWYDGLITDDDFLKGIEFLVKEGIINAS